MLAIACDKCRRRYTATDEELRVYLEQAEGKKYAQVLCPHCGKASKVAVDRIHQALRFSPPPAEGPAPAGTEAAAGTAPSEAPTGGDDAPHGPAEEVNPSA
jgi:hypothetical protein